MTTWQWPGSIITRVLDGDTVQSTVIRDLGFGGTASFTVRLRLDGINAPKLGTVRGNLARQRLAELLIGAPVDLTTLKPYKYGGPNDSPGEWMARIVLPDGRDAAIVMVTEGFAVAWDGTGTRPDDY